MGAAIALIREDSPYLGKTLSGLASEARAEMERALVKTRLEKGEIHEKILEVARDERCDLIVMGGGGKKGFFRRLLGDKTLEKVLSRAACPVLVVGA